MGKKANNTKGAQSAVSLKSNEPQVNLQFKILSAIGIIIIVSGHCYHGGFELAYNWFPPYSFNIALFAFISGYFYKNKYENAVGGYIWKRAKRLVIPAYLWNVFYGVFSLFMGLFGFTIGAEINAYNLFVMPFVDGEALQYNVGSWFVYPLFLVTVFNILFRKLLKLAKIDNESFIMVVYAVIGLIGVYLITINQAAGIRGILKLILRSMFMLPCFGFGRFYRAKLEKHDKLGNVPYFAIIFAVQLVILTVFKGEIEYRPSSLVDFNHGIFLPYLTALTAVAFWLRVSKLLVPVLGNSKIVRAVADNTYLIMINHLFGFMCVNFIFLILSKFVPVFSGFNVNSFHSTIWYYYLPNGLQLYGFVYLLGGLSVPILIGTGLKKVKAFALKNLKKPEINK